MRDTETDDADVIDDEPILLHMPCEHCSEWAGRAVQDDGLLRAALEQIAACDSPGCGDDHHSVARTALNASGDER